jgi:hypothetical protein
MYSKSGTILTVRSNQTQIEKDTDTMQNDTNIITVTDTALTALRKARFSINDLIDWQQPVLHYFADHLYLQFSSDAYGKGVITSGLLLSNGGKRTVLARFADWDDVADNVERAALIAEDKAYRAYKRISKLAQVRVWEENAAARRAEAIIAAEVMVRFADLLAERGITVDRRELSEYGRPMLAIPTPRHPFAQLIGHGFDGKEDCMEAYFSNISLGRDTDLVRLADKAASVLTAIIAAQQ